MDAATFRLDMPEFADSTLYPDTQIERLISIAEKLVSADVWGDLLDYGTELWVAHYLSLWRRDADTAASGGIAGQSGGVVSSKAVGPVSVSYDVASSTIEGMGELNLTRYGVNYARLARQMGMGAPSAVMGGSITIPFPAPI